MVLSSDSEPQPKNDKQMKHNSGTGSQTNAKELINAMPQLTHQDKQVIQRVGREAHMKYTFPFFIGSSLGFYTLSHLKIIKKSGRQLIPYYIGSLVMSSLTGKMLSRRKLGDEMSKLDTPMGKYIREVVMRNERPADTFEQSWKNYEPQKPKIDSWEPSKAESGNWQPPNPKPYQPSNQPINILGSEYKSDQPTNKPKTNEKPKRYNKYGDEIMD